MLSHLPLIHKTDSPFPKYYSAIFLDTSLEIFQEMKLPIFRSEYEKLRLIGINF